MAIIYIALSWCLGIIISHHWHELSIFRPVMSLVAIVGIWTYLLLRNQKRYRHISLILISVALGSVWFHIASPTQGASNVSNFNQENVVIAGIVTEKPVETEFNQILIIDSDELISQNVRYKVSGKLQVIVDRAESFSYGDRVEVRGQLLPPPELDNFSYRNYLARRAIFSQMRADIIRVLDTHQGNPFRAWMLNLSSQADENISESLSEPQAGLLKGILLGDDNQLSGDVETAFELTGTSHIIAISGFNMAIIAGVIGWFFASTINNRQLAVILSIIVIGIYTVFVGANPAVIRAAIMSSVLIFATVIRRRTYAPSSLMFTALLMTIQDPLVLWDIGFQLSLAAVMGMALLVPPMSQQFEQILVKLFGEKFGSTLSTWLSEPVIVTLAAQIATLPIILIYFGQISPITLVANFLIIPFQPLVLIFGGIATMIGFISLDIASLFYQADWIFLSYTLEIVRELAKITDPIAVSIAPVWGWLLLVLTIGIVITRATNPRFFHMENRKQLSMALIKFLPATALVMSLILFGNVAQRVVNQPDGKLHVVFLDQGQSNAVLIHTPDNGVMLINGGQFPVRLLTELGDRLPSNHRTIDILMITSDDRSDIAAVPDLTERYDVQVAIIADGLIGTDIGNAINALEQDDTTIIRPQPNQRITTDDGVQFDLILVEDVDEMLIRLIYKDAIFLFNNDLSSGETDILMQYQAMMQSTVLQASQHATANSNDEEWLDVVSPQIIIVQNDASSRQSQTSQGVIEQLQNIGDVYQTTEVGSVELVTDGELIEIYVSNDD